jgi:hypothetical protein
VSRDGSVFSLVEVGHDSASHSHHDRGNEAALDPVGDRLGAVARVQLADDGRAGGDVRDPATGAGD